jgi:hypothetical protein
MKDCRESRSDHSAESLTDVEDWRCQFDVTEVPRAFFWSLFAGLAVELAVNGAQSGVIHTLGSRPLTLLILYQVRKVREISRKRLFDGCLDRSAVRCGHTIVSGYSTWTTLMRLISSGAKRPN